MFYLRHVPEAQVLESVSAPGLPGGRGMKQFADEIRGFELVQGRADVAAARHLARVDDLLAREPDCLRASVPIPDAIRASFVPIQGGLLARSWDPTGLGGVTAAD